MKTTAWIASAVLLAAVAVAAGQEIADLRLFEEDETPTLAPLLEEVTPAVVNVAVAGAAPDVPQNPLFNDPFFRRFFDLPEGFEQPMPREGVGSGVIIDASEGLIVSNSHVVQGAEDIVVTLTDRRQFDAEVIGADPATDVALLRIPAEDLNELELGESDELDVGDFVVAIGNPFGLGQTATAGIVSALGRSGINIEGYEDFIQTDASINPGNSGGALVGLDGRLMGINTAILSPAGGNIGIGFAIPSEMVRDVVDQLLEYGEVRRGRVGIGIQDVTPGLAEALDLEVDRGALVTEVEEGSPAEESGVMVGDVVTAVNGEPVETMTDLRNEIGLVRLGETVTLTLLRQGDELNVGVLVGEADDEAPTAALQEPETESMQALDGAELATIDPSDPRFNGQTGVLVTAVEPGSPAAAAGLAPNDIISAVNRRDVSNVEELRAALEEAGEPAALRVQREGRQLFLLID